MSTTRPQLASQIRLDPWKQATNRFLASLSEDERKVFDTASLANLESLFYKSSNVERAYQTGKLQRVAQPLMDVLKQYKDVLDTFSDCNEVLKPVWGGILVVLTIASAYGDFFDKLASMFGKIGQALPNLRDYERLFQNDQRLMNHLTNAYFVILEFCIEVKTVFEKKLSEDKAWAVRHPTMSKMREKTLVSWAVTVNAMSPVSAPKWDDFMKRLQQEEKAAKTRTSIIHQEEQKKHREMTLRREQEGRRRRLLTLLAEVDIVAKHDTTSRRRQTDTATWILDDDKFKSFMQSAEAECLCCFGIVGSGKTFTSSSVIDYLTEQHGRTDFVSYHYFDHADKRSLSFNSFLSAVLRQLVLRYGWPPMVEEKLVEISDKGWLSISEPALVELILSAWSANCPALFLIVDGVDELSEGEQQKLLSFLIQLNTQQGIVPKSFITCRLGEGHLDEQLARVQTYSIVIAAQTVASDIQKIISQSLDAWQPALSQLDVTALKAEINQVLATQGEGMFLLVKYHLEELMAAVSIEEMETTLNNLPKNVAEAYDRALARKLGNKDATSTFHLATQAFKWLLCARRPLKLVELMEAVILEPDDQFFPRHRVMLAGAGRSRLLDACGNLIVHDKASDLVTLAHSTVKQYLVEENYTASGSLCKISQSDAERQTCELCMVYLNFKEFDGTIVKSQPPLIMRSNAIPGAEMLNTASSALARMSKGQFLSSSSKPVSVDLQGLLTRAKHTYAVDKEVYHLLDYVKTWWVEHIKLLDGFDDPKSLNLSAPNEVAYVTKLWTTFADLVRLRQCAFHFKPWEQVGSKQATNEASPVVNIFKWAVENENLPLLSLSFGCFVEQDFEFAKASLVTLDRYKLQPVLLAMKSRNVGLAQSIFVQRLLRPRWGFPAVDTRSETSRMTMAIRRMFSQKPERVQLIIEAADNIDCAPNFRNALNAVQAIMGTSYHDYASQALLSLIHDKRYEAGINILNDMENEPLMNIIPYMETIAEIIAKHDSELESMMEAFFRKRATHQNATYEIITWICDHIIDFSSATDVVGFIRACDPPINELVKVVGEQCEQNSAERLRRAFLRGSNMDIWKRSISQSSFQKLFFDRLSLDARAYLRLLLRTGVPRDLRLLTEALCDLSPHPPPVVNEVICNLLLWAPMVCAVSRAFAGFSDNRNGKMVTVNLYAMHDAVYWSPRGLDLETSSGHTKPEQPAIVSMFEALELLIVLKIVFPDYISDGDTPWRKVWQSLNTTKPLFIQSFTLPTDISKFQSDLAEEERQNGLKH